MNPKALAASTHITCPFILVKERLSVELLSYYYLNPKDFAFFTPFCRFVYRFGFMHGYNHLFS